MADDKKKDAPAGSPVASFQTRRDKPIEVLSLQEKFIELRRARSPGLKKNSTASRFPTNSPKLTTCGGPLLRQ